MVSGVGSGRYIGRTLANVNFDRFALTVPQANNIMHNRLLLVMAVVLPSI